MALGDASRTRSVLVSTLSRWLASSAMRRACAIHCPNSALERGDLVVDHHLELTGAREARVRGHRPGVDLAGARPGPPRRPCRRRPLRARPDGWRLGDGGGGVAQILGAAEQGRHGKETHHRQHHDGDERDELDGAEELTEIGHFSREAQPGRPCPRPAARRWRAAAPERWGSRTNGSAGCRAGARWRCGRHCDRAGLLRDLVGSAQTLGAGRVGGLAFRFARAGPSRLKTDSFRASSTAEKANAAGSFWGVGILRHTLYNSRVGTTATRRTSGAVITSHPFPGWWSSRNNSMQMPRIIPPNLRRRRAPVQSPFIHSILRKPNAFLPKG